MACDHLQPEDIMRMAEEWLRDQGLRTDQWDGAQVYHGENTPNGMWAAVIMELERRGDEWIVTRLDRNRQPIAADACGLRVLVLG